MNYWMLGLISAVVIIVSLVLTVRVLKEEDKKIKKYEGEEDSAANELKRSNDYEKESLTKNVKNLSFIYVIVTAVSIIVLAFYIFSL